jgi:hypothetical protein
VTRERRSLEEVRGDAHVVRRLRVERWLVRRLTEEAARLSNVTIEAANNTETWKLRGRVQLLIELVAIFRDGRER